jgi:hypothetical protein
MKKLPVLVDIDWKESTLIDWYKQLVENYLGLYWGNAEEEFEGEGPGGDTGHYYIAEGKITQDELKKLLGV